MNAAACEDCGRRWFPSSKSCPVCGSTDVRAISAPDRGVLESFTIIEGRTVGEIRLDGGLLVLGRVIGGDDVRIGARLTLSKEQREVLEFVEE